MSDHAAAIFRHPIKGFTPEALSTVRLAPGEGFPFDRLYAVENGPSGFDPAAPAFVPKKHFTVLAHIAKVAAAKTRYDEATGALHATAPGVADFLGDLSVDAGRTAFAAWLKVLLGDDAHGQLKVIAAPGQHRFTDHPLCGIYVRVTSAGALSLGDAVTAPSDSTLAATRDEADA